MKKVFLPGIAALFLATGAAQTSEIKLPKDVLGKWCLIKGWSQGAFHYRRRNNDEDYHTCSKGVDIYEKKAWYFEGDAGSFTCDFLSIEFNYDIYLVHQLCHGLDYELEAGCEDAGNCTLTDSHQLTEFLLTDDRVLILRDLPEG